ncbi:MAG: hypothetical protein NC827_05755, partial [Candidatus Omnitrophica bacterium]|nr:hypothetical protein [Candidatus Omnitrophota bacterium]
MKKIIKVFIFFIVISYSLFSEKGVILFGTKEKKIEFIKKVLNNKDKVYLKEIAAFLDDEDKEIRS